MATKCIRSVMSKGSSPALLLSDLEAELPAQRASRADGRTPARPGPEVSLTQKQQQQPHGADGRPGEALRGRAAGQLRRGGAARALLASRRREGGRDPRLKEHERAEVRFRLLPGAHRAGDGGGSDRHAQRSSLPAGRGQAHPGIGSEELSRRREGMRTTRQFLACGGGLPERWPAVEPRRRWGVRRPRGGGGFIYGMPAATAWRVVLRGGRLPHEHGIPAAESSLRRRRGTGCGHGRRRDGWRGWRAALGAITSSVRTPQSASAPRSPHGAREPGGRLVGYACEALRGHRSTARRAVFVGGRAVHRLHLLGKRLAAPGGSGRLRAALGGRALASGREAAPQTQPQTQPPPRVLEPAAPDDADSAAPGHPGSLPGGATTAAVQQIFKPFGQVGVRVKVRDG